MNNFKGCIHCVCLTGSDRKRSCKEQNIGTQCGATTTNTATETVEQSKIINCLKNQQNQPKQLKALKLTRQLEVVPSPAEVCQSDLDGYPAARWRRPPYLNIPMLWDDVQQISPHMTKVNVMAKFNTVPDSALSEIEEYLDI